MSGIRIAVDTLTPGMQKLARSLDSSGRVALAPGFYASASRMRWALKQPTHAWKTGQPPRRELIFSTAEEIYHWLDALPGMKKLTEGWYLTGDSNPEPID